MAILSHFLVSTECKQPLNTLIKVRVGRIEPPSDPWQGPVIPLNYTRDGVECIKTVFENLDTSSCEH